MNVTVQHSLELLRVVVVERDGRAGFSVTYLGSTAGRLDEKEGQEVLSKSTKVISFQVLNVYWSSILP